MHLETGDKKLDATLNLVPFIDLLSCCIAFLLITAVWSQSAQLTAHTAGGSDDESARPKAAFQLLVARDGCTLTSPDGRNQTVSLESLRERLQGVGEELMVSGTQDLPYDLWIRALDAARSAGVVTLAVSL